MTEQKLLRVPFPYQYAPFEASIKSVPMAPPLRKHNSIKTIPSIRLAVVGQPLLRLSQLGNPLFPPSFHRLRAVLRVKKIVPPAK